MAGIKLPPQTCQQGPNQKLLLHGATVALGPRPQVFNEKCWILVGCPSLTVSYHPLLQDLSRGDARQRSKGVRHGRGSCRTFGISSSRSWSYLQLAHYAHNLLLASNLHSGRFHVEPPACAGRAAQALPQQVRSQHWQSPQSITGRA